MIPDQDFPRTRLHGVPLTILLPRAPRAIHAVLDTTEPLARVSEVAIFALRLGPEDHEISYQLVGALVNAEEGTLAVRVGLDPDLTVGQAYAACYAAAFESCGRHSMDRLYLMATLLLWVLLEASRLVLG